MGRIRFRGDTSGKTFKVYEPSSGEVQIVNENDNVTLARINPTSIYDAGGVQLSAHGSRHNRGGADPITFTTGYVFINKAGSSVSAGTGGAYGSESTVTPDAGFNSIIPFKIRAVVGGTFASGETVTIRYRFYWSDGTTTDVTTSVTATGNYDLDMPTIALNLKNGAPIPNDKLKHIALDRDGGGGASRRRSRALIDIWRRELKRREQGAHRLPPTLTGLESVTV